MCKLATLRVLDGDLEQGVRVVLEISTLQHSKSNTLKEIVQAGSHHHRAEISGALPPNPSLASTIDQWQTNYRSLGSTRIRPNEITYDASINQRRLVCQKLDRQLRSQLNTWLSSPSFGSIRDKWLEELMKDEVRVLVRTSDRSLLKLPWHLWDLVERNPLAEVALSAVAREPVTRQQTPTLPGKVRILAILGDSTDINIEYDRQLLKNLAGAETVFLPEPQRREINDQLWEQDWDILYFAGHSRTEGEQGRIYINKTESLSIENLRYSLRNAVDKGLQLAIFNSCDGMGLAFELEQLHLPLAIVMREPVPDEIAQEFLRYFLPAFVSGRSLYLAEREARLRLHGREDEFPGASWLPVIFQSPATTPPTWADLGRRPTALCPYRGLFAFREQDALFFHGRESFTQILVEAVQRHSFVSVIGASGSGKSSVIFAGLVAELRQQKDWQIVAFRPGQRPLQAIATAWVKLRTPHLPPAEQLLSILQLAEAWRANETALSTAVEEAIWEAPGTKLLIVVDQFEELYTQCQDAQDRQTFIDGLLKVTELTNVVLVLTLRTDFLGQALAYRPLADVLQHGNRMLGAMSRAELQSAIAQPAALLGITLEDGLTERMIKAVSHSEGSLPLLEFALQELWGKRQGTQLTHATYDEIGGLEAAVARYAEQAYSKLNESEKVRSRQIFLQLIRPGEGTEDTRRIATRAEIGDHNWELATRLASERLVVARQDMIAKTETVELVHEALIREWQRLQSWVEENRVFRTWQERLRSAMQQWEASSRDEGALLRGKPLVDAEDYLQKRSEELTGEQEFIAASLKLQVKEEEKLSRQRKRTVTLLATGLIGALGLAATAGVGWWLANNAATKDRIRVLVSESQSLFSPSDTESAFYKENDLKKKEILFQEASLKAIKAGRQLQHLIGVDPETRFQVLETLRQIVGTKVKPTKFTLPECELLKRGPVSLTWTSDRKTIACVNYDGTVRLWDGSTGKKTNIFQGETEWVDDVEFSPDGKMIASGTADGTVKLWKQETGKEIRVLKGHISQVNHISFSPNGKTLAAANYDGTIILWNIATGRELKTLSGHSNLERSEIKWIFFSPNSQFLASMGYDGTLKLWEVATGKELKTIRPKDKFGSPTPEIHASFSSNSQIFIYSDGSLGDVNVRFWNIAEKRELKNILVPGEPFFSPDGRTIAVIDYDDENPILKDHKFSTSTSKGTVSLWDTATGKKVKILSNLPSDELAEISFSSDSSLLAIYTYDNNNGSYLGPVLGSNANVTFWRRNGARLKTIEQLGEVFQMNFSPDGQKVVIASAGPKEGWQVILRLWDVSTGKILKTLIDEPVRFSPRGLSIGLGTEFSPDGKRIVAVSSSGIAKFFDSATGEEKNLPNVSPAHDLDRAPIISRDGQREITLRTDGSMRFRNRSTGEEIKINRWDSVLVSAARFSDDNKTIVTVNWYGKIQERELATGQILKSTNLPFRKLASRLEFSPDGRKLASAMSDDTIKIWDISSGKEIITLKEYASKADFGWVKDELLFSPDGKIIAALGKDYNYDNPTKLELWEVQTGKTIQFSKTPLNVKNISFSPNSSVLAILNPDTTIQLWNLSSRKLEKTLKPTLNKIERIQFNRDGKSLFVFNFNEVKMLNIETVQEIASFKISSLVESVEFSADSKTLILQESNQENFIFLNFNFENLLNRSCNIVRDYLKNNPNASKENEHLCDSSY